MTKPRILVIGFGNPGRLDDGLGPRLAEAVAAAALPGVAVIVDYSLQVEHAAAVAEHDLVVLADAAVAGAAPFTWHELPPDAVDAAAFSTHVVSPAGLMALAGEHLGARPRAFVLAMRGYEFDEFGECLSPGAADNLAAALAFLLPALAAGRLAEPADRVVRT